MIINIPTVVEELKENATEEQRCGLNILEGRFYECIDLKKKLEIATKALEKYAKQNVFGQIARDALKALKEMEEIQ